MSKCKIQWYANGQSTLDTNEAIGYVYLEEHTIFVYEKPLRIERSVDFPICAEHAKRLNEDGMHHWHFVPFEATKTEIPIKEETR